jgi:2-keto-4-pentenoate hydratase/2-oxohepta-3-ene-1,7-dioic acid hydratase in catechol pathway
VSFSLIGTLISDLPLAVVETDHRNRKPNTALGDPWPAVTTLPKLTETTDSGDYESELAVVIGKTAKNVTEAEAMDYVLGYTAANDISSREYQLNQSQWCFSKGFDGSMPLGERTSRLLPEDAMRIR